MSVSSNDHRDPSEPVNSSDILIGVPEERRRQLEERRQRERGRDGVVPLDELPPGDEHDPLASERNPLRLFEFAIDQNRD